MPESVWTNQEIKKVSDMASEIGFISCKNKTLELIARKTEAVGNHNDCSFIVQSALLSLFREIKELKHEY